MSVCLASRQLLCRCCFVELITLQLLELINNYRFDNPIDVLSKALDFQEANSQSAPSAGEASERDIIEIFAEITAKMEAET